MKKRPKERLDPNIKLLQDILITQLGLANVPQQDIRSIVGVDLKRVTKIVSCIRKAQRGRNGS